MAENTFNASVSGWVAKSKRQMTAVYRQSAQTLANEVRKTKPDGGNMPIVTGNLRRSLMASTSGMPVIAREGEPPDNEAQVTLVIAKAKPTDPIYLGFQAAYARRMEYGFTDEDSLGRFYDQEGNFFVRHAADKWQEIVQEAATLIKRRDDARAAFTAG